MSKFLFRALVIMNAYFFAVIGAFAIIAVSFTIQLALDEPDKGLGYILSVSFLLAFLAAGISPLITLALPAIAIITAEYASLRSWIYYAGAGAVTGFIVFFTIRSEHATGANTGYSGLVVALSLLAGITGGLIYWGIAGRNAGMDIRETGKT